MKKIYSLLIGSGLAVTGFCQPDIWPVGINPAEVPELLGPKRRIIDMMRVDKGDEPIIDGIKDAVWDKVPPGTYDRYITYYTICSGDYCFRQSLLDDGAIEPRRLPANSKDFSGTYRVIYDDDYIYCFFDITDNEVNDGYINPGYQESFEFQVAPYADSAQELLKGKPYPPYTGAAPEINKKYAYWHYLGAFKYWFFIDHGGKCRPGPENGIRQHPDAVKIDYVSRFNSCGCAWQLKADGTGYTAEISFSLKVALADSANNPFVVPATNKDTSWIAFEMKCFDYDLGMKIIQASWNAEDLDVYDAIIYGGKLMMKGWTLGNDPLQADEKITYYPNPAVDAINFSKMLSTIDIISINGLIVKSEKNVSTINVNDLSPGIYVIKSQGKALGKFAKL
jgi:hypothetical protein